jgi:hypothetical protein
MSIRHTGRFLKLTYGKELNVIHLYEILYSNFKISYIGCLACDDRTYAIIDFGYKINITSYKKVIYENSVPIMERIEDFKTQKELLESKGELYTGPTLPDAKIQEIAEELSKKKCTSCDKTLLSSYFRLNGNSCKSCERLTEYQALSKKSKTVQKLKQIDPEGVLETVISELIELRNAPLVEENRAIKEELEKTKKHMATLLKNVGIINNAMFKDGILTVKDINKNSGLLILDICDATTFANYNGESLSLTYRTFKTIPVETLENKRVIFIDYVYNMKSTINKFKSLAHRDEEKYMEEFKVVLFSHIQPELWDVARCITNKIICTSLYRDSFEVSSSIGNIHQWFNGEVRICDPEVLKSIVYQLRDFVIQCPKLQADTEESLSTLHPEVNV